jgi:hypothetical protein
VAANTGGVDGEALLILAGAASRHDNNFECLPQPWPRRPKWMIRSPILECREHYRSRIQKCKLKIYEAIDRNESQTREVRSPHNVQLKNDLQPVR